MFSNSVGDILAVNRYDGFKYPDLDVVTLPVIPAYTSPSYCYITTCEPNVPAFEATQFAWPGEFANHVAVRVDTNKTHIGRHLMVRHHHGSSR